MADRRTAFICPPTFAEYGVDRDRGQFSALRGCTGPSPARETVLSGVFGSIGVWPHHEVTAEMRDSARLALGALDIAHLEDVPLTEMSSGEVRRAVIGRALVHHPRALVLD